MIRYLLSIFAVLMFASACQKLNESEIQPSQNPVLQEKSTLIDVPEGEPITQKVLSDMVIKMLSERKDFRWEWVDLRTLWSALQYNDHSLAIGYKPTGYGDISGQIHEINLQSAEWKAVHDALIKLILDEHAAIGQPVKWDEILVEDDPVLPIITIRLTDKRILTKLYNLENVRYLEPLDYWYDENRSTSGCSSSSEPLNSSDWSVIAPGSRLPWNYSIVNIPEAWNTSEGQGIKIGVIDAGISSGQSLLNGMFTTGYSNVDRTVSTEYTYGTSAFTSCSHGTAMSGIAVGPRNANDAPTGVAYKASLHFIRACADVVLDESGERTGVKNALVRMGNNTSIQIISMSIGTPFYSSVLYDGTVYAYNKGKMIFAAAGTSYGWTTWWGVIYPAAFSQCIAVTGVKENSSTCSSCHDGSQVLFSIPMERNTNSNRNSISLRTSGYTPAYIGGSSCATATMAGIAALVWSVKPSMTRSQVYTCLRNTSQYYPNYSGSVGYGNPNAAAAVAMALSY